MTTSVLDQGGAPHPLAMDRLHRGLAILIPAILGSGKTAAANKFMALAHQLKVQFGAEAHPIFRYPHPHRAITNLRLLILFCCFNMIHIAIRNLVVLHCIWSLVSRESRKLFGSVSQYLKFVRVV
jgi:hypothetical protein